MQRRFGGHMQFNVQGESFGLLSTVRQGARQTVFPKAAGRQAIVTRSLGEQVFINATLLPVACHKVLTEHTQIHHCRLEPL